MEKIEFYSNGAEYKFLKEELIEKAHRILSEGKVVNGDDVMLFENEVANLTGRKHAVAVNSCTDALYLALCTLGVGTGDEVLVTDFSFVASANCIKRVGATPIFVDISERDFNMDLNLAEKKITDKTKAIIYVHLYGKMGKPSEIIDFAKKHNLLLIEDAAQAFGAQRENYTAGKLGFVSCFSFGSTKPLSAPGSGGMLLTDDEKIYEYVKSLRYHGKTKNGDFSFNGLFSLMSSITAAFLRVKLKYIEEWTKKRQSIAHYFIDNLGNLSSALILPEKCTDKSHIYHKFVIKSPKREFILKQLEVCGIPAQIHYQKALHKEPVFQLSGNYDKYFPISRKISENVFSLPIHPFLMDVQVEYIVDCIKKIFKEKL